MFIDEQDIFNYVKYPDKLTPEKREYIKDHPDLFESELEFLNDAPEFDNSDLPEEIKLKLHFKLLGKNPKQTLQLVKLASPAIKKNHIRNLAADSASTNESSPKSISFSDKSKSYLIKVLLDVNKTTIYTFTPDNKELNNFSLFLRPSGGIHHLPTNKSPLTLEHGPFPENIDLILF